MPTMTWMRGTGKGAGGIEKGVSPGLGVRVPGLCSRLSRCWLPLQPGADPFSPWVLALSWGPWGRSSLPR